VRGEGFDGGPHGPGVDRAGVLHEVGPARGSGEGDGVGLDAKRKGGPDPEDRQVTGELGEGVCGRHGGRPGREGAHL